MKEEIILRESKWYNMVAIEARLIGKHKVLYQVVRLHPRSYETGLLSINNAIEYCKMMNLEVVQIVGGDFSTKKPKILR